LREYGKKDSNLNPEKQRQGKKRLEENGKAETGRTIICDRLVKVFINFNFMLPSLKF
jgi:hypothetical protein